MFTDKLLSWGDKHIVCILMLAQCLQYPGLKSETLLNVYTERHPANGVIKSKDDSLVIWEHFTGTNHRGAFLQNTHPQKV